MRERPILFTAPMVRAILAGKKTQTRRLMKPQPEGVAGKVWPDPDRWAWPSNLVQSMVTMEEACALSPYGMRGERLWVKETHALRSDIDPKGEPLRAKHYAMYQADRNGDPRDPMNWHDYGSRWRPSIFMPRTVSRITLEVSGVRVERVQDISEADAWAEGIDEVDGEIDDAAICKAAKEAGCSVEDAKATYGALWDEINGARRVKVPKPWPDAGTTTEIDTSASWASNPWVWVVEFRRAV